MSFRSGLKVYRKNKRVPLVSSGDSTLDELLGEGGFHKDLVYLLYGDKKKTSNILLTTSVIAQKSFANGGLGEKIKVAYIDANNRFNPYNVSKFAVSLLLLRNLSLMAVLERKLRLRILTQIIALIHIM